MNSHHHITNQLAQLQLRRAVYVMPFECGAELSRCSRQYASISGVKVIDNNFDLAHVVNGRCLVWDERDEGLLSNERINVSCATIFSKKSCHLLCDK